MNYYVFAFIATIISGFFGDLFVGGLLNIPDAVPSFAIAARAYFCFSL